MRNGLFNADGQARLAKAIVDERDDRDNTGDDSHLAGAAQLRLRREAVEARQEYKKALKIKAKVKNPVRITAHERKVLDRLADGTLERRRNEANNAYGHGKNVSALSKEQAIVMRAFTDDVLNQYFTRDGPVVD